MNYLYLYSCCIPVRGAAQSVICDIQRRNYEIIPNTLYDFLINLPKERNLDLLRSKYFGEELEIFDSYIEFLIGNEFIYIDTELHDRFSEINLNEFDLPYIVSNAIIDYNEKYDIEIVHKIIKQLDELRCEAVELRIFKQIKKENFIKILDFFNFSGIRCINLVIEYSTYMDESFFGFIESNYKRVREITLNNFSESFSMRQFFFPIYFMSTNDFNEQCCGFISPKTFSVNIQSFTEALQFNSCLNRKISIDQYGNIKKCPSMKNILGSIFDTSLIKTTKERNFRDYEDITKDQIEVCKDCEFRYICTDCRAFVSDKYAKPKKCNYNPYTAEWEI